MKSPLLRRIILGGMIIVALVLAATLSGWIRIPGISPNPGRISKLWQWLNNPQAHQDWAVTALEQCGEAPFLMPTSGYIGFVWDDSFRPGHRHQGLDIFGGQEAGLTPVYAAYDGYLTRLADWKSSLIIRIPSDPLQPGRQIWTYYTHMADSSGGRSFIVADYPPGSREVFVEAGTLLGYQGDFSGDPNNPVGVHLHFSIVRDSNGQYLNELRIENTIDPSAYLGLPLHTAQVGDNAPVCPPETQP